MSCNPFCKPKFISAVDTEPVYCGRCGRYLGTADKVRSTTAFRAENEAALIEKYKRIEWLRANYDPSGKEG